MGETVIELRNVSKYFEKVIANKNVSFHINKGEVLALLGENGAGKSTIMKILYGLYKLDEGTILIDGQETRINSPKDAMAKGIAMIQQHFSLVPVHTVTENIILGNVSGKINLKKYNEKISKIAKDYGFEIPVDKKICELSVGVQQKVEILKALYLDARILIMDEPTAVLTPQESDTLMEFIKDFTAKGNSIIFITHKMKEVMKVADHIIVMRNGIISGDLNKEKLQKEGTDEKKLSRLMMGEEIIPALRNQSEANEQKQTCLSVKNIVVKNKDETPILNQISFDIQKGEIFGVAGVSGNGQDELCEAICGIKKLSSGSIIYNGKDITKDSIRQRIQDGIGYVPVDRYRDGMVLEMTLAENMMLKSSFDRRWRKGLFIDQKKLEQFMKDKLDEYKVKATGPSDLAKGLSGGNQQKVVLAREVEIGTGFIVFNQPTRGLDLGASNRIHATILEEKKRGKGVLLVSTELTELFALSDRIAIMFKGECIGIYKNGELTTEQVGLLMAGYKEERRKNNEKKSL